MKYFSERESSGFFSLAGEFCVFEKLIPGGLGTHNQRQKFTKKTIVL